ncbi:MAG: hypothetical protein JWM05_2471 [Acidimicrobiales bacterium]|nr:hypothetical protein [Acidimicrobiales bacterium]
MSDRTTGRGRGLALAASMVALLALGACSTGGDGQHVRAGASGSGSGSTVPQASTTTTAAAIPGPYDEVRARYDALTAPPGAVEARAPGSVVERVALPQPVQARLRSGRTVRITAARRLTITGGPFPYGDARIVVFVDGVALGEGRPANDRRSLSIGVLDPAALAPGGVVSFQIGVRPPVTVGALKAGS